MSSLLPAGFDPQASLDAALFAAAGGSSAASSDPAVEALDELGGSYGDEISFLQQQLEPSSGAYDPTGAVAGAAGSETDQLEQALTGLLGGDSLASAPGDEGLLDSLLPYDDTGSPLAGGSSLVDLLG